MNNVEQIQCLDDILRCMETLLSFPGDVVPPGCIEGLRVALNEARDVTWEMTVLPREVTPRLRNALPVGSTGSTASSCSVSSQPRVLRWTLMQLSYEFTGTRAQQDGNGPFPPLNFPVIDDHQNNATQKI